MKTSFIFPIADIRGSFGTYHIYHYNGKAYLRKNPVFTKPPTEKQLMARQIFKERYCKHI